MLCIIIIIIIIILFLLLIYYHYYLFIYLFIYVCIYLLIYIYFFSFFFGGGGGVGWGAAATLAPRDLAAWEKQYHPYTVDKTIGAITNDMMSNPFKFDWQLMKVHIYVMAQKYEKK